MKKVGYVYKTRDYDSFKKLQGNRAVLSRRKNIIINSIQENGYIRNPIVVNEKLEIIDGQGRFEALKELGLPIEYVLAEGASTKECIALNLNQKNWQTKDFIESYATEGDPAYKLLLEISDGYKNLTGTLAWGVATNKFVDGGNFEAYIKSGKAKIHDCKTLSKRLMFGSEFMAYFRSMELGRARLWASIINFLFYTDCIDNRKLIKKIEKYRAVMYPAINAIQCIKNIEKVYNRNASNKVYLEQFWDIYIKEQKEETKIGKHQ